jgi:hypothetical protein
LSSWLLLPGSNQSSISLRHTLDMSVTYRLVCLCTVKCNIPKLMLSSDYVALDFVFHSYYCWLCKKASFNSLQSFLAIWTPSCIQKIREYTLKFRVYAYDTGHRASPFIRPFWELNVLELFAVWFYDGCQTSPLA